jgi:pilus assembly protein CpaB
MNIRTIATLAVAILLGIVAVLLVRGYVSTPKPGAHTEATTTGATSPVVVAAAPIARGQALVSAQLKVVDYPAASVPVGSFQAISQLNGAGPNARLAMRPLVPNEPILSDLVTAPGARLILSTSLANGMRAVTLRSSETAGVAGFVLPGDHVDILLTRTLAGSGDRVNAVTQAVAEDVLVMASDQSDDDQAAKPVLSHTLTVEVTPAQAGLLTLAQTVGAISLTLRHVSDDAPLSHKVVTAAQLGYFSMPPSANPAPAAVRSAVASRPPPGTSDVHVVRGVNTSTYAVTSH